jgi:glycosyltransferase involved in cell wall biosynthesis
MNQTIRVSVIVPVYNVEPYIHKCLDSLINQSLREIEIILIDDCSKDNSGKLCDEYAKKDTRISVIHNQTNLKQGLSRNKGIELAKGDFIGFVDPDDWVDTAYYEDLYHSVTQNNSSVAKAVPVVVYSNGKKIRIDELNKTLQDDHYSGIPLFVHFYKEHWTGLYRRSILMDFNIRYPDIRNAEDDVFLLRYTFHCNSISFTKNSHYYYRQRNDSTLSIKHKPYFESGLQYFRLYMDFINNHCIEKQYYDQVFTRLVSSVYDRYNELKKSKLYADYSETFASEAMKIILTYKYSETFLYEHFSFGISGLKRFEKLKHSMAFKIGQWLVWLPKVIKNRSFHTIN